MHRWIVLSLAGVLVCGLESGCETQSSPDPTQPMAPPSPGQLSKAELFAARHRAWLHAERDSEEGFHAAEEILRELSTQPTPDPLDCLNWVRASLRIEDALEPEAATALRDALEAVQESLGERTPPDVDFLRAVVAMRAREPQRALPPITRVTEARPGSVPGWYLLGRVHEDLGDLAAAQVAFSRLLALDASHRPATYHQMLVLGRLGRKAESEAMLARFDALPTEGKADPERCSFTEVSFRPPELKPEPPIALTFALVPPGEHSFKLESPLLQVIPREISAPKSRRWAVLADGLTMTDEAGDLRPLSGNRARTLAWGALDPEGSRIGLLALDVTRDGKPASELREVLTVGGGVESNTPETLSTNVIQAPGPIRNLRLADVDHDGDLDAVLITQRFEILRNDGDGTWILLPSLDGTPPPTGSPVRLAFDDFDGGNDLDLVFPAVDGARLYWNRRDHFENLTISEQAGRTILFAEDFNGDGRPELLGLGGGPGSTITHFDENDAPRSVTVSGGPVVRLADVGDLDADGDLDLVVADEHAITYLRNDRSGFTAAGTIELPGVSTLRLIDFDGDLRLDILAVGSDQTPRIYQTEGSGKNSAWLLRLDGRRDQRDGIGCVVEQVAGTLWQTRMVKTPGGLHLGLGERPMRILDGIRLRWPAGIIQALPSDRFEIAEDGVSRVRQKEGLVASCPFLFARGAAGWQFVTDVLGIAPLDEWRPPGTPALLDPEEHVRIPGSFIVSLEGVIELAITEELREITYLDALELRAVDHPIGTALYADESTTQGSIVPLRLLVVVESTLISPPSVSTENGENQTAAIRRLDHTFLHPEHIGAPQLAGWTEPQRLTIAPVDANWLLLTGRVAWYDSTAVYALHPSARGWAPPRLWGIDANGARTLLVEEVGLPAGLDRTVLIALPDAARSMAAWELECQHRLMIDRLVGGRAAPLVEIPAGEGRIALPGGTALRG